MFSDSRVPRLAAHQFLSAHEENVCVLVINMSILAPGSATRIPLGFAYRIVSCRVVEVEFTSRRSDNENVVVCKICSNPSLRERSVHAIISRVLHIFFGT